MVASGMRLTAGVGATTLFAVLATDLTTELRADSTSVVIIC